MAEGIPARLTASEGRAFGLKLGAAFLVLGTVAMWRGKHRTALVMQVIGGLLVVAGLLIPTTLGPVERAWMGLGHAMGKVTQPIFMGIVYFGVMTPIGFFRRRTAGAPMTQRTRTDSRWEPHTPAVTDPARMERQF